MKKILKQTELPQFHTDHPITPTERDALKGELKNIYAAHSTIMPELSASEEDCCNRATD